MKPIKLTLTILLFTFSMSNLVHAQASIEEREAQAKKIQQFYEMALVAYRNGNIDEAKTILRSILAENPGNGNAMALLQKLKQNGSQQKLAKKRRQFNAIILDQVEFKEVTLSQALKILNQMVINKTNKKFTPNFVIQDPKKYLGDEKISFELNNIPAGTVLDNLMQISGCSASFDKYTISIRPRPSAHKNKPKKVEENVEKEEEFETVPVKPIAPTEPAKKAAE